MRRDLFNGRRADGSRRGWWAQAFKTHSSELATGMLVLCIFLLLIGLALQLLLDALLVPERSDPLVSNQANEVAVFGACLPQDLTGCFDEQGKPRFSRTRIILTFLPTSELPSVLALLLKHRVVVSIARVSAPPWWVPLLWKVAPLWLLFLLISGMDTTRRWKW